VHSIATCVHSIADAIKPSFCTHEHTPMLTPWLGCLSAGALEPSDKSQILHIWTLLFTLVNPLAVSLSNASC
jgi:hypothetical protein